LGNTPYRRDRRRRTIDADEAYRLGLYHEIVPEEKLWARGVALSAESAESAQEALQLTKRMLNETIGDALERQLTLGAAADATSRTTEAATEGIAAFLEKREPKWP